MLITADLAKEKTIFNRFKIFKEDIYNIINSNSKQGKTFAKVDCNYEDELVSKLALDLEHEGFEVELHSSDSSLNVSWENAAENKSLHYKAKAEQCLREAIKKCIDDLGEQIYSAVNKGKYSIRITLLERDSIKQEVKKILKENGYDIINSKKHDEITISWRLYP